LDAPPLNHTCRPGALHYLLTVWRAVSAGLNIRQACLPGDFGYTWDEPLFSSMPTQDTLFIREWFVCFNLENSWASVYDHKIYGPAYILAGAGSRGRWALAEQNFDLWRLVNFICFQAGSFCCTCLGAG
jgi:hypothetical protein